MDSRKLNLEELDMLRNFVQSRGFRDREIQDEILDHFACKTEEILSRDANLDLNQAMRLAHQSFGVRGFRDIAFAYESQVRIEYKRVFWKDVGATFRHPLHGAVLLLVGYLYSELYLWAAPYTDWYFLDHNPVASATILLWVLFEMTLLSVAKVNRQKMTFRQSVALGIGGHFMIPFWCGFFPIGTSPERAGPSQILLQAIVMACLVAGYLIILKARIAVQERLRKDDMMLA